MSRDELAERLYATFVAELDDQVRALNADLLALEASPADAERIRSLFRSAHAVKGAARVANVPAVEDACHALESLFARIRDGETALDRAVFELLFTAVDALADARDRLRDRRPLDGAPLSAILPQLHAAAEQTAAETQQAVAQPAAPASAPPAALPPPRSVAKEAARTAETPAARPAKEEAAAPAAPTADDTVRVRAEKLDVVAQHAGELVVASRAVMRQTAEWLDFRNELARWAVQWTRRRTNGRAGPEPAELETELQRLVQQADRQARGAVAKHGVLERAVDDVVGGVRRLRLRPMSEVLEGLPRAVRDIAARTDKRIELQVEGGEIEADRVVIDALREPLLHLVRNAADHGIESPAARAAAGKPETGTIRIATSLRGGRLRVTVEDDGAGVDAAAARRSIASRGGVPPADDRQLAWLLLGGGISTRTEATELSGRGVGLDLVRTSLERLGGTVRMMWRAGRGTRFIIEAPPMPAALRAVLVAAGGQLFAIPASNVERLVRVVPEQVRHLGGRLVLPIGGQPVPLVSLAAVLGPPLHPRPLSIVIPAMLVESGEETIALTVDELVDSTDIVIRPLDRRAVVPHIAGGALLATGEIALVLSPGSLVEAALRRRAEQGIADATGASAPRRVLVADDSITTRTLEQSVLESAGYLVTLAVDGEHAWEQLQDGGIELVLADVEMPRADGFELCRRIRAAKRFSELPIVLVTGLESAADRARGLEAGADAYITKSSFDQTTLLDTIRQLIG